MQLEQLVQSAAVKGAVALFATKEEAKSAAQAAKREAIASGLIQSHTFASPGHTYNGGNSFPCRGCWKEYERCECGAVASWGHWIEENNTYGKRFLALVTEGGTGTSRQFILVL